MHRYKDSKEDLKDKFHFENLVVPLAFINGLFFGGFALRKIRRYWEGGPMD